MSETENKSCGCLKCKTSWALALSIISVALNVILITALIAGARCHKKRAAEFRAHPPGAPGMQCPMGSGFNPGKPGFGGRQGWRGADAHGGKPGERLAKALDLDAAQQAKVKQIMDEQKAQIDKLGQSKKPEDIKKIIEDGKAKIRAVLKPDQQKKLDELMNGFQNRPRHAQPWQ